MMFIRRGVWVLFGVLAVPVLAHALESKRSWEFADLVVEVVEGHPALLAKRHEYDATFAGVREARSQRYPTPGLIATKDDRGWHETRVFLEQPLWSGGRIKAGIDAAHARERVASEDVGVVRDDMLMRLVDAYTEALRRQAQQRIHQQNVQQHERLQHMIQRRVARQISPPVDQELARSRFYLAVNEQAMVDQALSVALFRLAELAGQPVDAVASVQNLALEEIPHSLEAALELARQSSPVLARFAHERMAADADVRSARAAYWPVVSLRLEHRNAQQSDSRAMVQVQSQFGPGMSTGARVEGAVARREALTEEQRAAQRYLESGVSAAWQEWNTARLRLDNSRINRESASNVFSSYERQYAVGQKSWLDLLNAVRESIQAELLLEDAQAEMFRAALRLRLLTGGL